MADADTTPSQADGGELNPGEAVNELLSDRDDVTGWVLVYVAPGGAPWMAWSYGGWSQATALSVGAKAAARSILVKWRHDQTKQFTGDTIAALQAENDVLLRRLDDIERELGLGEYAKDDEEAEHE